MPIAFRVTNSCVRLGKSVDLLCSLYAVFGDLASCLHNVCVHRIINIVQLVNANMSIKVGLDKGDIKEFRVE